ncbi:hypothetical protein OF83DRAFT_563790 [Amylostereum chailletii]|nr:hypothetical protein OF83DRAFT_563790 [Amylostereum chailletii]
MKQAFGGLPYEIVEKIIDHLASRDDLLTFALLCSYTKAVALPRLEYHTLITSVFDVNLWRYMAENPGFGRYVRKLTLYHERGGPSTSISRTYRIPSELRHPLHESMFAYRSSISAFEDALQTMSGVREIAKHEL